MELIRTFAELGKGDAAIAGGKGASLGEMTQAGIPVPPGFVVLADVFERFIDETNLVAGIRAALDTVDTEAMSTVEEASRKIQDLILSAEMPADIATAINEQFVKLGAEHVAVRSSATAEDSANAAWAGQLDTYLNTTEAELLRNVQRCWASLFTPRAIFYRFEKGLHTTHISVAVVVQAMVHSEVSGIAFSVHPVTEDRNQLIIEAGYGLGEAIVSGQVTPDSYVVEKSPRKISEVTVNTQTRGLYRAEKGGNEWKLIAEPLASAQTLETQRIHDLAEIILTIEKHYGFPCDIEWAFAGGKFYITQSRPITTLSAAPESGDYHSSKFIKMGRWGTLPLDTETWHTVHTSRYFEEKFGIWKEIMELHVREDNGTFYNEGYAPAGFIKRLQARIAEITATDKKGLEKILLKFYDEKKEIKEKLPHINPSNLGACSTEELVAAYEKNRDAVHFIVVYDQFTWLAEGYWLPLMDDVLVNKHGLAKSSPEYTDALFKLIKPYEISTTLEEKREVIQEAVAIQDGAQTVEQAAARLAADYGWMPVLAFGVPWGADHYIEELGEVLKRTGEDSRAELTSLEQYSQIQKRDFDATVAKYGIAADDAQLFVDFGLAIDTRNEAEYSNSVCGFYVLPLYQEIAKRLGISVTQLREMYEAEVVACLRGQAEPKAVLAAVGRMRNWYINEKKERIDFTEEQGVELLAYLEHNHTMWGSNEGKRGITANKGRVRGVARLVPTPEDNHKVGQGEILFAYSTMVDNLPAMKKAGAIVTESGGLTCHAAVVAREFGIPAIVSLKNAMSDFADGDMVEVDAEKGVVRKI